MLSIGLTGGIAAGKSLLANRFRELGATVVDADQLARDVVAPGTPGLAAVVAEFGADMLMPDGSLNRPKIGSIVFGDPAALAALNGIVHPLVRAAAAALKRGAGPGAVVVQDIPLLVETGQGPNFHLVVVVQAPLEARLARMLNDRGMSRSDAEARIAAQASDAQRGAVADVVIPNDGTPDEARALLDALWHNRLLAFSENLAAGRAAVDPAATAGSDAPVQEAAGPARLLARLRHCLGDMADVGQAGSKPVLRVAAKPGTAPGQLIDPLADAGFFPMAGNRGSHGAVTLLASADPGQRAVVELAEDQP